MDLALTPSPAKLLPFTDAAFSHHHHPTPPPAACYKECMKNHAAAISGHAVDGCGEFMPSPTTLKCAACSCHHNFHRREPDSPTAPITPPFLDFRHPTQKLLALSTAADGGGPPSAPARPIGKNPAGRKRFRSKFSREQKEKMQSFSEKLGWKMQQCDEDSIEEFCNGIEVAKGVFKVWMHNNKNTIGKKESNGRVRNIVNGGIIEFENNGGIKVKGRKADDNGRQYRVDDESGGGVLFHGSNNGSSSST